MDLDAGPRAVIDRVPIDGVSSSNGNRRLLDRLQLGRGLPYDGAELDQRLSEYEAELRREGYYEARVSHEVEERDGGRSVSVLLEVRRGPRVTVAFAGDPVPAGDATELVTIEREASVNEDFLEDDGRRIADRLRQLGYRDAEVTHARSVAGDELSIVFHVARGPLYRLVEVGFRGNEAVETPELRPLLGVEVGDPLVVAEIDRGRDAIVEALPPPRVRGGRHRTGLHDDGPGCHGRRCCLFARGHGRGAHDRKVRPLRGRHGLGGRRSRGVARRSGRIRPTTARRSRPIAAPS